MSAWGFVCAIHVHERIKSLREFHTQDLIEHLKAAHKKHNVTVTLKVTVTSRMEI